MFAEIGAHCGEISNRMAPSQTHASSTGSTVIPLFGVTPSAKWPAGPRHRQSYDDGLSDPRVLRRRSEAVLRGEQGKRDAHAKGCAKVAKGRSPPDRHDAKGYKAAKVSSPDSGKMWYEKLQDNRKGGSAVQSGKTGLKPATLAADSAASAETAEAPAEPSKTRE